MRNRPRSPFNRVVEVGAGVDIFTASRQVWDLIRPAENAVLLEPSTVRAFHVPGSPFGVGELQGYIAYIDGRERLAMNEVLEEIEGRYRLVRTIGTDDDSLRRRTYSARRARELVWKSA